VQVAAECGIQAMPTFQVYKSGKKVGELTGANKDRLAQLVSSNKA
jgi:thioredoxin 1